MRFGCSPFTIHAIVRVVLVRWLDQMDKVQRFLKFREEPVAESHGVSIIDIPFTREELDEFDSDKYDALVAKVDPNTAHAFWYTWGLTALVSAF